MVNKIKSCVFISGNGTNLKSIIKSSREYNFPITIKSFIDFLNSDNFTSFLQKITSIKEKLLADPYLEGGGLHEIKSGGILKIHTDFNRHPFLDLDRRVNVLIYLNKDWKHSYGGHLELWNQKTSAQSPELKRAHQIG